LIDQLNGGIDHKLMLISAPAGFGKTTLLSEWIFQTKIPVAWISPDKGDSDPIRFIHYLIAALQNIETNIGKAALSMMQSSQQTPIRSIMTILIKDITEIPKGFALVFDDYHSIDAEKVHNIVELLLALAQMDSENTTDGIMYANVPIKGVKTLYSSIGNLLGWLCALGLIIFVFMLIINRVRRDNSFD
jgi:ATP/maltotriose-dependent transcriptional regulator MalT